MENESGESEASKFHSFRPSTYSPATAPPPRGGRRARTLNRRSSTAPSIGAVEVNRADGVRLSVERKRRGGRRPKDFAECYGLNRDAPTSEGKTASSSDVVETERRTSSVGLAARNDARSAGVNARRGGSGSLSCARSPRRPNLSASLSFPPAPSPRRSAAALAAKKARRRRDEVSGLRVTSDTSVVAAV